MLSVIILGHNRHDRVKALIDSVKVLIPIEKEIILIDNGSDPPYESDVKILRFPNILLAKARNEAIRQAKGEYILMLDDDITIGHFSLNIFEIFDKHPLVKMIVPDKIDRYPDYDIEYSVFKEGITGNLKHIKDSEIGLVDFGCQSYLADAAILKELLYDECFGENRKGVGHATREESALQANIRKQGYEIYYAPEKFEITHHIVGGGFDIKKHSYWTAYNNVLFIRKYCKHPNIKKYLWFIILCGSIFLGRRSFWKGMEGYFDGLK